MEQELESTDYTDGSAAEVKARQGDFITDLIGWLFLLGVIGILVSSISEDFIDPNHRKFIMLLGVIGIWRYSNAVMHYCRGMYFLYGEFPRMRKAVTDMGKDALPSEIYLVVTSFRIPTHTTYRVYESVFKEALITEVPVTVVVSIVERSDERLIKRVMRDVVGADNQLIRLIIVRARGTGKRDGLSHAFKAISRDAPASDAIVGVVDGDTVLMPKCVYNAVSLFKLLPTVGGLTTDEYCVVEGGHIIKEWHTMRFVQRHINMCSMALSKRVLTMTGRLSFFRSEILTHPDFIADVREDFLDHWRLGRFRFLTGDDKSSWFSLMRMGWDTFYVPDSKTVTVEHPPSDNFFLATVQLMKRWYGNSLRQNFRAMKLLGRKRLGWFTSYVLMDQRVSMWTSLLGLCASVMMGLFVSIEYMFVYFLWILVSRTIISITFLAAGHGTSPVYPFVLYYNQVLGSIMKIHAMFHLDQQKWTRQKTTLKQSESIDQVINRVTSKAMMVGAIMYFAGVVAFFISLSVS